MNTRILGCKAKMLSEAGLAGLFVDGFLKHQMARLHQLDRSLCNRTLSLQEFQVKNCLFLLKRKWKKVTLIIAAFSLAFCLFPRSGSLRGCGGAKARVHFSYQRKILALMKWSFLVMFNFCFNMS
ncbi:uncharacterized protein G2W53_014197 [Senna tora]|uniref:Uncharacterized protein n=1 Tax=Senna tora TaxID=362788 RepID=A0A834WT06_9FABA|nr:uncharacterized protein G2W53_014197 [Senna tora]